MVEVSLAHYSAELFAMNSRQLSAVRKGSLLKVSFPWGVGFSDYCPMAEESFQKEWEARTPQAVQSLQFAFAESLYRAADLPLIQSPVPDSHRTLPDWTTWDEKSWLNWESQGFRFFKLKCGRDERDEAKRLAELKKRFPKVRFRLDFNGNCKVPELWEGLLNSDQIDLVEDPVPFDLGAWKELEERWKCRLALDLEVGKGSASWSGARVIKPAIQSFSEGMIDRPVMVTSFMDHPVGICFAAWTASLYQRMGKEVLTCGLLTQDLSVDWASWLTPAENPRFPVGSEAGIGWEEKLLHQKWTAPFLTRFPVEGFPAALLDEMKKDLGEEIVSQKITTLAR